LGQFFLHYASLAGIFGVSELILLVLVFNFGKRLVTPGGPIAFALGVSGGYFATWFVNSPQKAVRPLTTKWWGATFGFRLCAFACGMWLLGTFVFLDSYERSVEVVLGPIAVIFAAYYGFKHLVVGSVTPQKNVYADAADILPAEDKKKESTVENVAKDKYVATSVDRERSMDELIKRMKNGS